MSIKSMTLAAAAALVLSAGAAFAQGTATTAPAATAKPATKPVATKKAKAPAAPRSAESLKCSADADAKALKGKERKKFRSKCMSDAKKAAKPKAS